MSTLDKEPHASFSRADSHTKSHQVTVINPKTLSHGVSHPLSKCGACMPSRSVLLKPRLLEGQGLSPSQWGTTLGVKSCPSSSCALSSWTDVISSIPVSSFFRRRDPPHGVSNTISFPRPTPSSDGHQRKAIKGLSSTQSHQATSGRRDAPREYPTPFSRLTRATPRSPPHPLAPGARGLVTYPPREDPEP